MTKNSLNYVPLIAKILTTISHGQPLEKDKDTENMVHLLFHKGVIMKNWETKGYKLTSLGEKVLETERSYAASDKR